MLLRVLPHHSDWPKTLPKLGSDFDEFVKREFKDLNLAISIYSLPSCDHCTGNGQALLIQTLTEHRAGATGGGPSRAVFVDVAGTQSWGLWTMAKAPPHTDQPFFAQLAAAHHILQFKTRADLEEFALRLLSRHHADKVDNSKPMVPWHTVSASEMRKYGKGRCASDAEWKALCDSDPSLAAYWS